MDRQRRASLARLLKSLSVVWLGAMERAWGQVSETEAQEVDRLYSTKLSHVILGNREYRIPANYFGPKQGQEPAVFVAKENGFGFSMFLPDYGGYTKENWREGWFHPLLIQVIWVKTVNKNAMLPMTDGSLRRIRPAGYGDPKARFANRRARLEDAPSFKLHGLDGYRRKGKGAKGVTWVGARSNGEFFFFDSTLSPEEQPGRGRYSFCQAQYYSEQGDLNIAYRYQQRHIANWREIDDAIWTKLREWRVK